MQSFWVVFYKSFVRQKIRQNWAKVRQSRYKVRQLISAPAAKLAVRNENLVKKIYTYLNGSTNARSSKTGKTTIEMSKGKVEKLRANYMSDKVFSKNKHVILEK